MVNQCLSTKVFAFWMCQQNEHAQDSYLLNANSPLMCLCKASASIRTAFCEMGRARPDARHTSIFCTTSTHTVDCKFVPSAAGLVFRDYSAVRRFYTDPLTHWTSDPSHLSYKQQYNLYLSYCVCVCASRGGEVCFRVSGEKKLTGSQLMSPYNLGACKSSFPSIESCM